MLRSGVVGTCERVLWDLFWIRSICFPKRCPALALPFLIPISWILQCHLSEEFQSEVGLHASILTWLHTYIFWNVPQLVFKVSLAFNISPLRNMKEWAKRLSSHKDTSASSLLETTLGHSPAKRAALVLFGRMSCKRKAIELRSEC